MQRITKAENKELRKQFPARYFHATRHHDYVELRPCVVNALKVIRSTACIVLVLVLFTACGRRDGVLYADDCITVDRTGSRTTITTSEGSIYHFGKKRVRRQKTTEETIERAIIQTVVDDGEIEIGTVRDAIIVTEPDGTQVYIR